LPAAFQLLAIGRTQIHLFDLANAKAQPTSIKYEDVQKISRVTPKILDSLRRILLHDDSELYSISVENQKEKGECT